MQAIQLIREYGQRIKEIEHADFNPLAFTCTGGMAPQSPLVLKKLAEKLSEKQNIQLAHNAAMCPSNSSQRVLCETNIELAVATTRRGRFQVLLGVQGG